MPNISYGRILSILKEANIQIRDTSYTSKKYNCNDSYFDVIDTPEKAYWIGFLYADGYLTKRTGSNSVGITISNEDIQHLYKFKSAVQFTGDINTYTSFKGFQQEGVPYSRISIISQHMCDSLERNGMYYNKSGIIKFPTDEQVPTRFHSHFIRGYFDGNGCLTHGSVHEHKVTQYKVSICSTHEMLRGIEKCFELKQLHALYKRHKNDVNNYSLDIGGNKQVVNILNYLYANATVYLDRKYEKYLSYLQYVNSRSG